MADEIKTVKGYFAYHPSAMQAYKTHQISVEGKVLNTTQAQWYKIQDRGLKVGQTVEATYKNKKGTLMLHSLKALK